MTRQRASDRCCACTTAGACYPRRVAADAQFPIDSLGSDLIRVGRQPAARFRSTKRPAVHSYAVLAFHLGGQLRMEHHGELTLTAGQVHLIPAGDAHRVLAASAVDMCGIAFCHSCLAEDRFRDLLAPLDRVRRGAFPVVELPTERQSHVLHLLEELERELARSAGMLPIVAESLLGLILAEIVRAAPVETTLRETPPLVAEALAFIESRCLGPLTLGEVARAVHRSPAHLTTAVKQATGRSVVAWIVEGRLAEARRRLRETDEFVEIIAERVGYADASQFSRLFRRHHGMAPAAWRARERTKHRPGLLPGGLVSDRGDALVAEAPASPFVSPRGTAPLRAW
ncbi:AraC family transcriptional regulator [Chondromyces crocatus]|uniref:AraC family transcriptional regulator n=1 Tax=Chondromyces crocatus TaxID=52 RepID=A0A0K1ELL6_CHOCO|nr:AraC family transcriptional regulator [Chondromyces crocatus]AKT41785.1 AraC family transcriptional regulator [Chondromyces crocatus]